ncbi:mucin-2-like [Nymphalis io]|uniref:mucin-2-like n=1 Tax=Inachis io TaxID=171585 RepID=UPI00216A7E1A|nr:mucin-2-like [Nymphalis io]
MEDAFALVVLTLLQLCRAEISNTEWYAANLINDPSYTPKPITEIFTTDLNFSPKISTISTQTNPRMTPPNTTTRSSAPATTTFGNSETATQQDQAQRIPFQMIGLPGPQQQQIITQAVNDPKNELSSFLLIFDPRQQTSQLFQQPINTSPPTTTVTESTTTETTTRSMQTRPTTVPPQTSTQTQANIQETTILPRNLQSQSIPLAPMVSPTFVPGRWDIRNIIYPIPNIPIVNSSCNTTTVSNTVAVSSTIAPQTVRPGSGSSNPFLTVRLKTPKGSLTNIRINPTTTKKPTTTRRRKSNKKSNDYEICLRSCDGKKEPICSSPIGVFPINPDRLKGFASLCHMACHNSFRKDQVYEKVTEGRCGRLRTRIRPVDKNKLNRDELNKATYTIQHNAPETIMEFSPLTH